MVHPVWYGMLVPVALGFAGMAVGARGTSARVKRERWCKTVSYTVIVVALVWVSLHGAPLSVYMGGTIVVGGAMELLRAAAASPTRDRGIRCYETAAGVAYTVFALAFLAFLGNTGGDLVVFVILQVCCFDSFSQVVGQIIGKRPLAPAISPNKTVEGFLGGLAAAVLAGWLASHWSHTTLWALKSVLIALSSLAGDLVASHFKRRHNLKDFSNWIPYQGGFLDRFDSLIAAGAVSYAINLVLPA